ncbi:MAG: hypothetical protein ACRBFS_12080 [Aureispira sp.]
MIELKNAVDKVLQYANERFGGSGKREYILDVEIGILEKRTFWYIPFIEKRIDTQVGFFGVKKGIIVNKESGNFFELGSGYATEDWIWGYELGFTDEHIDFTITKIKDQELAIKHLDQLGPQYLQYKVEEEYDVNDIKYYSTEEIRAKISNLPCTFKSQNFTIKLWVLQEIMETNSFEYYLQKSKDKYGKNYGELIKDGSVL